MPRASYSSLSTLSINLDHLAKLNLHANALHKGKVTSRTRLFVTYIHGFLIGQDRITSMWEN